MTKKYLTGTSTFQHLRAHLWMHTTCVLGEFLDQINTGRVTDTRIAEFLFRVRWIILNQWTSNSSEEKRSVFLV